MRAMKNLKRNMKLTNFTAQDRGEAIYTRPVVATGRYAQAEKRQH